MNFRRWRNRERKHRVAALSDRRLGPLLRRAPVAEIKLMLGLYRDLYRGFTVKLPRAGQAERLHAGLHGDQAASASGRPGTPAKVRSPHREKHSLRPIVGMMLHQDASAHAWLPGDEKYDLVVTMDDATSAICSLFLVDQVGAASSTARRAHRSLLAASPWPLGAAVRHATGPATGQVTYRVLLTVAKSPVACSAGRHLNCPVQRKVDLPCLRLTFAGSVCSLGAWLLLYLLPRHSMSYWMRLA